MTARLKKPTKADPQSPGQVHLVLAAERLFAETGVNAVALRQVNQAAGHKNASAAHYHFGSREGMVRAVFEHRLPAINSRRAELLAAGSGQANDMRLYVRAFILPLAEQLAERPEGNHYLRFLEQYMKQHLNEVERPFRDLAPAINDIRDNILRLLSYLPKPLAEVRFREVQTVMLATLAMMEAKLNAGMVRRADLPALVSNLIDMTVAALNAPVSPETMDALD